jgi:hypothetical protein
MVGAKRQAQARRSDQTTRCLGVMLAFAATVLTGAGTAAAAQFRADQYPMSFAGSTQSEMKISVDKGLVRCTSTTLSGAEASASEELALVPVFSGCVAFGFPATVKVNSCSYVLHSTNDSAPLSGSLDVACGKVGDAFEVSNAGNNCVVSIPAQNGLGTVALSNEGTNRSRAITATLNIGNLQYGQSGASCKAGSFSTGTVKGSYVLNGVNEQLPHGVYVASKQQDDLAQFRTERTPALLAGGLIGELRLTTDTGVQNCTTARLASGPTSTTADMRVSSEIEGCHWFGFTNTATTTGCDFVFYTTTSAVSAGAMSIVCTSGSEIVIQGPPAGINCQIRIPAQSGLSSVMFKNVGSGAGRSVNVELGLIGGLRYTEVGTGCASPGSHTDGGLQGTVQIKGYEDIAGIRGAQQGLWIS